MKLLFLLFAISFFAALVSAQSPSKVLRQAEKALGGAKQLQSIQSVTKRGTVRRVGDGAQGRFLSQTARPNLLNVTYDLNGEEVEIAYNGRSGWMRSGAGVATVTGSAVAELQALSQFRNDLWLNAKREKARLVSSGQANIDGKSATVVTMTTAKGPLVKMYFDAATGLLLRDEVPSGGTLLQTDYADYRVVGGSMHPYFQRVREGDSVLEVTFDDIRINDSIARSDFDFPNLSGEPLPDIPTLLREVQANAENSEVAVLLGALPRVEAPENFEFGVKARIATANESPKSFMPSWAKVAAPVGLVFLITAFVVFFGMRPGSPAVQTTATTTAPVQTAAAQQQPVSGGGSNIAAPVNESRPEPTVPPVVAKPRETEVASAVTPSGIIRPRTRFVNNRSVPGGGSSDFRVSQPRVLTPRGIPATVGRNANTTEAELPVRDLLQMLGVSAEQVGDDWTVRSTNDNSIASRSGLKPNDVIEAIDEQSLSSKTTIKGINAAKSCRVRRDGKQLRLELKK